MEMSSVFCSIIASSTLAVGFFFCLQLPAGFVTLSYTCRPRYRFSGLVSHKLITSLFRRRYLLRSGLREPSRKAFRDPARTDALGKHAAGA